MESFAPNITLLEVNVFLKIQQNVFTMGNVATVNERA